MTQITTTQRQFSTAKKFAAHMIHLLRPSYVRTLDDMRADDRLSRLIDACERFVRWPIEDGGIEPGYNGAIYGFWQAVRKCAEAETCMALCQWDTRRMLEVTHDLMVAHEGTSPHEYAKYLDNLVAQQGQ